MIGPHLNILSGFAFNSKQFNDQGDGMPLIRIRDVGKDSSETFYSGDFDQKFIVKSGDILIGMDGDFRLAVWRGERALLNQRVCKIESKGEVIDRGYLIHMLPRELQRIEDSTSYATVKHLSVKKIKAIEMPLPPLEEQKRIAGILDEADRVRKKTQALIDKYDELAQSLFLDMFGDPVTNPKGWELKSLSAIADVDFFDGDWVESKDQDPEGGIRLIQLADIGEGKFLNKSAKFINSDAATRLKVSFLKTGDLLMARMPDPIGRTCVFTLSEPCITAVDVCVVRCSSRYLITYLNGVFSQSGIHKKIERLATGTTRKRAARSKIGKVELALPDESIIRSYSNRLKIILQAQEDAGLQLKLDNDLFNALLQKAFKGELT
jgi:type I restriction enzyme S subunit